MQELKDQEVDRRRQVREEKSFKWWDGELDEDKQVVI